MAIGDDLSVTRANGNIRATGGTANYTVLELHRWLGDLSDDASSVGDDEFDITDLAAASRRAFDTIITLNGVYNIDDATAQRLYGGSITQGAGGTLARYSGVAIAGSFPAGSVPQIVQNNVKLTAFWNAAQTFNPDLVLGFSHQFLVKTTSAGALIDGGRVRAVARGYGFDYREAATTLGVGFGVLAVGNIQVDPFNSVTLGNVAIAPYNTVAINASGYTAIDIDEVAPLDPFYIVWTTGSTNRSGFYNRLKYLTRDGETATILGLPGELFRGITHEIDIDTPTGTFAAFEAVSWATGTGQMLAIDSVTAGTKMWIQLLTGVAPTDGQTITGASTATADVNVTVIERTLPLNSVVGNYFGTLIGGYGVGVLKADLTNADTVQDLDGDTLSPPATVLVRVNGVEGGVSDQDRVILGRRLAGVLETAMYTANGAQGAGSTTFVVVETIDPYWPQPGNVRIFDAATNSFKRVPYTSFAASTFTLTGTIGHAVANLDEAFGTFLDDVGGGGTLGQEDGFVQANSKYSIDVDVIGVVRNGGASPIQEFPLTGTVTASGFQVTAVRTPDA